MATQFREFMRTYEDFQQQYPGHPLLEELRDGLLRKRLPTDDWLKARTKKMKQIMEPIWVRGNGAGEEETVA